MVDNAQSARGPLTPRLHRVHRVRRELRETHSLELEPCTGSPVSFSPGQFNMLYVFGIGEVPISLSGDPARLQTIVHTVRAVGAVSQALCRLKPGDVIGVRGPFGNAWPLASAAGGDVLIVAGGLGLAPLRPAIYHLLRHRATYDRVAVLYGARTPADILFARELGRWQKRASLQVEVTVDSASPAWQGRVGVVPALIARAAFNPERTVALVCGPEVMMRFTVRELLQRGVPPVHIFLSLERNMKCAVGLCGRCQLGPTFLCKDGPVFPYAQIAPYFAVREV